MSQPEKRMMQPNILLRGEFLDFEDELVARAVSRKVFPARSIISGTTDNRRHYSYYILHGLVTCSYLEEDGTRHISNMRGRGTIFPLYFSVQNTSVEFTIEFTAARKSEVLKIPKAQIRALIEEDTRFAIAMIDAWSEYATYQDYVVESLYDNAEQRVCAFLAVHADERDGVFVTQANLARATGLARENVSRLINRLEREGLVEMKNSTVRILDRDAIVERASYVAQVGDIFPLDS